MPEKTSRNSSNEEDVEIRELKLPAKITIDEDGTVKIGSEIIEETDLYIKRVSTPAGIQIVVVPGKSLTDIVNKLRRVLGGVA